MKDETYLINLRNERAKDLKIWQPTKEEITNICDEVRNIFISDNNINKWPTKLGFFVLPYKQSKYYQNLHYCFGEFVGEPKKNGAILIYWEDIATVNYYQKDLIVSHLYFIIEHEVKHWLGMTHEDMHNIKDFKYPGE